MHACVLNKPVSVSHCPATKPNRTLLSQAYTHARSNARASPPALLSSPTSMYCSHERPHKQRMPQDMPLHTRRSWLAGQCLRTATKQRSSTRLYTGPACDVGQRMRQHLRLEQAGHGRPGTPSGSTHSSSKRKLVSLALGVVVRLVDPTQPWAAQGTKQVIIGEGGRVAQVPAHTRCASAAKPPNGQGMSIMPARAGRSPRKKAEEDRTYY